MLDFLNLPWYSWVCLGLLVVVLIVYKIQKNKQI